MNRPNVIILIVDALRAKNLSCYGYESVTTPHMDEFAARNILFRRAFTPATWTIPSHASLLSGLYLSQHRIENVKADRRLNPAIVTLPQALQSQGYRSAVFTQNRLFSPEHHFDQFDEFHGFGRQFEAESKVQKQGLAKKWRRLQVTLARYRRKMTNSRTLFDAMLQWTTASDNEPFLAVANVTDVHYAWAVPPLDLLRGLGLDVRHLTDRELYDPNPFRFNSHLRPITARHRAIWQSLYDCALTHVDREIGRFLQQLKRWHGWDNTILILTSDHGEMLGDGRHIFGHTLSLHDNIMRVPFIMRHPDYEQPTTVEGVVQTLDIFPSVLEWARAFHTHIPAAQLQRPSLTMALAAAGEQKGYAFAEEDYTDSYDVRGSLLRMNPKLDPYTYAQQQIAVRSALHKFLWRSDGRHEFYDLETDPDEQVNRMDDESAATVRRQLQQVLDEWRASLDLFPPVTLDQDITLVPEVNQRLRALGYLEA